MDYGPEEEYDEDEWNYIIFRLVLTPNKYFVHINTIGNY